LKYLIFSDVHSNLEALEAVLDHAGREGYDMALCLGDIIGYGANPRECVEIVSQLENSASIMGNHDLGALDPDARLFFNDVATVAIDHNTRTLDKKHLDFLRTLPLTYDENDTFVGVHSSPFQPGTWRYILDYTSASEALKVMDKPIAFIGHTHFPAIFFENGMVGYFSPEMDVRIKSEDKCIINVGSVGQPRDEIPKASFVLFDDRKMTCRLFRVEYDRETAAQKILDAKLPPFLAKRVLLGF
jgi:predicted phosphodiesterase